MFTSIKDKMSPKLFFKGSISLVVSPFKASSESFLLSSVSAFIKSLIDSACIKFNFP